DVLGGEAHVQAGQAALAVGGFGGLVVEPDGGAEPGAGRGESERVAGAEAELGGDFAVPGGEGGVVPEVGQQRLDGVGGVAQVAARGRVGWLVDGGPVRTVAGGVGRLRGPVVAGGGR
ncbi:hypothetical protein GTW78_35825, partial [Streptomyces sp. SID4948]|nr:hypothetical protein [Streptomyces sp. SID4948]